MIAIHEINNLLGFQVVSFLAVFGCSDKNHTHKNEASVSQSRLESGGFGGQLSQDEVPLKIVTIPSTSKIYIKIPSFSGDIGVVVKDGDDLIKRYSVPALKVTNANLQTESFETSYSTFSRFSNVGKMELELILENNVKEPLNVLVYKMEGVSSIRVNQGVF